MNDERKEMLQTLVEKMASVMRRVYTGHGFRLSEFKLGPPQVRILFFIAKQKQEVAVKDLAEMLKVTPGAITQLVDPLVEMGLVRREEDLRDRRIARIKLTELTISKLEEFKRGYVESASMVFGTLNDKEIKELVILLDKADSHNV